MQNHTERLHVRKLSCTQSNMAPCELLSSWESSLPPASWGTGLPPASWGTSLPPAPSLFSCQITALLKLKHIKWHCTTPVFLFMLGDSKVCITKQSTFFFLKTNLIFQPNSGSLVSRIFSRDPVWPAFPTRPFQLSTPTQAADRPGRGTTAHFLSLSPP